MQKITPFPWLDDQADGGEKQQCSRLADRCCFSPKAAPAAPPAAHEGR